MTRLIQMGCVVCAMLWAVSAASGASNLVVNGSFDNTNDHLYAWKYKYDLPGESWYFQNHEHVKVVPNVDGHENVLALWGDLDILFNIGQGTKVDSKHRRNSKSQIKL